jgi:hypothetical protein
VTSVSGPETHTVRLEALGSTVAVACASAHDAAVLGTQWSRLLAAPGLGADLSVDLREVPAELQARTLLSQLTMRAIEAAAGRRLMLHAAGVADDQGRVVALVGPSGMGKTTAAVYLSQHGFGYVTDETVSVGAVGDVLPFGRPLWLRSPDGEAQRSPDELGLGEPPDTLTIARIVLLDRVPGHRGAPTVAAVPLVDALLELVPHASALPRLPEPLQVMSRVVDRCGGVHRLTYGQMDERVASLVSDLLGSEAGPSEEWRPLVLHRSHPGRLPSDVSDGLDADHTLSHGGLADGVATDEDALALVGDIPIRLGEIGLAIWEAARDGVAETEVVSVVERQHGTHPEATRIVREAVDQMLGAELLVHGADEARVSSSASR